MVCSGPLAESPVLPLDYSGTEGPRAPVVMPSIHGLPLLVLSVGLTLSFPPERALPRSQPQGLRLVAGKGGLPLRPLRSLVTRGHQFKDGQPSYTCP